MKNSRIRHREEQSASFLKSNSLSTGMNINDIKKTEPGTLCCLYAFVDN